jgi:hypothetical protein
MISVVQMNERFLRQELLDLKQKTTWSWETMARELERMMTVRGPSGSTLRRYATGGVQRPNLIVEHYVREALKKVNMQLKAEDSEKAVKN